MCPSNQSLGNSVVDERGSEFVTSVLEGKWSGFIRGPGDEGRIIRFGSFGGENSDGLVEFLGWLSSVTHVLSAKSNGFLSLSASSLPGAEGNTIRASATVRGPLQQGANLMGFNRRSEDRVVNGGLVLFEDLVSKCFGDALLSKRFGP